MRTLRHTAGAGALLIAVLWMAALAPAQYLKSPPDEPLDVDKVDHGDQAPIVKPTCWIATAANMLAGAGYGNAYEGDVVFKANEIYLRLRDHFGDSD